MLQGELCHLSPVPMSPPASLDTRPLQQGKKEYKWIFSLYFPPREMQQKKHVSFRGIKLEGCFLQLKKAPIFGGLVVWGACPTRQFLGVKPLSLLQGKDVKSCSTIRQMCFPHLPPYISISFVCFY